MDNYFYCNLEMSDSKFLQSVRNLSDSQKTQIYVLTGPLTDKKYSYEFNGGYIVLTPKRKVLFVHKSGTDEEFENYIDDVMEDIAFISDKYQFNKTLGRKRHWNELYTSIDESENAVFKSIYQDQMQAKGENIRKLDILISLFIGSINDAKNITVEEPDNILDKVKKKIQLFDTDQTRFIYDEINPSKKVIKIQGLSGTGKTELLLHKLKDIYVRESDTKICITCHNKVLAYSLRKRIPDFFNFMKVEQQIAWHERLWCVNAWGKYGDADSGVLRYICSFYNVPFLSFREAGNFENACKVTLHNIQNKPNKRDFAFSYMFIDESQDFDQGFFKLCEYITEKRVYVAGDIFQNIFEDRCAQDVNSDFLLSRCYRTDPKTLMFAQGLGMGLFEDEKIWWLEKKMWELCGYNVVELDDGEKYELTREPIRRFEDISADFESLKLFTTNDSVKNIVAEIKRLKAEFPNIQPDDIGIILLDNLNYIYTLAPSIGEKIEEIFGWAYNIAHETKMQKPNTVFISNRNNVKGLEFPFVFCVTTRIDRDYSNRNTLYTMLSRSFLRSYLIVRDGDNNGLTNSIIQGGIDIMKYKKMTITVPSKKEQQAIRSQFIVSQNKSLRQRAEDIMNSIGIGSAARESILKLLSSVNTKVSDEDLSEFINASNKLIQE